MLIHQRLGTVLIALAVPALCLAEETAHDATAVGCSALQPFSLRYELERGDTTLGSGTTILAPTSAPGCFTLNQTATPTLLLRWLSSPAVQNSEFCVLPTGGLRSYTYEQTRSGVGSKGENYRLEFDWESRNVRGGRFHEIPVKDGQTDALLLQLRVREWLCSQPQTTTLDTLPPLELEYIDKKGLGSYVFAVTGFESIKVPAGRFDTVRVERIDSKKRQARFWLDVHDNYQLIKGEQQKEDDPIVRLSLLPAD